MVDELARRKRVRLDRLECNALLGAEGDLLLAQPQTYMNRSGHAARCLLERRGLTAAHILVVYDDVALPLGRLRLRPAGSPGGHRGMESIIGSLCTEEVPRLRLGIGPETGPQPGVDLADWVLEPFSAEESAVVDEMIARAADACEAWLREEIEVVMNRTNG